jgi:hypothetical protein
MPGLVPQHAFAIPSPFFVSFLPPPPACLPQPTSRPTGMPTKAPVPACVGGTTYWLYDPATNAPLRRIVNNTATCLAHPYNVEVRPCGGDPIVLDDPVHVRLSDASSGTAVVHKSAGQSKSPFFLFGSSSSGAAAGGGVVDVLPSSQPLPNGAYVISTKGAPAEWGRLRFTQACPPCPHGKKKGKKGCRKQRKQ